MIKTTSPQSAERRLKSLSLLFEISQTLERSMDLNEVIQPVLRLMAEHMGMMRGTITLLDRKSGEIFIDAAYGLSVSQLERGKYRLGEGVTGKVVLPRRVVYGLFIQSHAQSASQAPSVNL